MTTLREAALAALALVNDTLLERTVDTKRLSAVGRDLEDALDAEPDAQPVAWYVERRAPGYGDDGVKSGPWWSKNEAKRFADDHHVLRPLYAAPQPPGDVPPMTDEDFVKIAFPYLDGALMEEIEMDGYALLEILRAVEAEVRRGCGVVE